jgi:hypothetical protein
MPAGAPSYSIFRLGSSGIGLRSKDRRAARQQLLWRATVIAFSLVAASAAVLGLLSA